MGFTALITTQLGVNAIAKLSSSAQNNLYKTAKIFQVKRKKIIIS